MCVCICTVVNRHANRIFSEPYHIATVAYPGGEGFGCSNSPPPRNSEGPPKNRAKLNPIVQTVKKKIAEFRTPTHQDVRKEMQ